MALTWRVDILQACVCRVLCELVQWYHTARAHLCILSCMVQLMQYDYGALYI